MSSQKFHILPNYLPVTDTLNKRRAGEVFERHSSYHWWSALKLLHIEISIFAIGSTAFHECFLHMFVLVSFGCTLCFCFLQNYGNCKILDVTLGVEENWSWCRNCLTFLRGVFLNVEENWSQKPYSSKQLKIKTFKFLTKYQNPS